MSLRSGPQLCSHDYWYSLKGEEFFIFADMLFRLMLKGPVISKAQLQRFCTIYFLQVQNFRFYPSIQMEIHLGFHIFPWKTGLWGFEFPLMSILFLLMKKLVMEGEFFWYFHDQPRYDHGGEWNAYLCVIFFGIPIISIKQWLAAYL